MENRRFYVYEDWTTDDTNYCFYVGIGTHSRTKTLKRNKYHDAIAQKHGIRREIVGGPLTEEEVKIEEIRLIAERQTYYHENKKGSNLTRGGEGTFGRIPSEYELTCLRERNQKRFESQEERLKIGNESKERWNDPKIRDKMILGLKESLQTQESKNKRVAAQKESWANPEIQEKRISGMKRAWSDPDKRERKLSALKENRDSHDAREKMSQSNRERWSDPEYKARVSASMKAAWERRKAAKEMKSSG